ncbi:hypothetical protein WJX81_003248 [Elliptochloris bilobata]|uniref:Phospholipid/glycerol acyltransferase domain-containing protein n=1 Tax=Elliptochloris bilobata TaxID=381761 RepID=A0AAW1RBH5_9CHLO
MLSPLDPSSALYDAFRRSDAYGERGQRRLSRSEALCLALLGVTIVPVKLALILCALLLGWLLVRLSVLLPAAWCSALVPRVGRPLARCFLLFWGFWRVEWVSAGEPAADATLEAAVVCSNHISYMDMAIHLEHYFPSFVARGDVVGVPFLGVFSQYLKCVYVINEDYQRRGVRQSGASAQVRERVEEVAAGMRRRGIGPLVIFPEGTTTNGRYLLPFRTGAFLAGAPVRPVMLRYGPGRVSPAWESIPPLWHLFLMLAHPLHSVTAYELPVYVPNAEERANPRLFADGVRRAMLAAGGLHASPATLADCRAYLALAAGRAADVPAHSRAGRTLLPNPSSNPGGEKELADAAQIWSANAMEDSYGSLALTSEYIHDQVVPKEVAAVLPANPGEQLRLAHAISCHAYAGRVAALESEVGRLRRAAADRSSHVRTLETRLTSLQLELQDALDKARAQDEAAVRLAAEKKALVETVRRQAQSVARLDAFRRNLLATLQTSPDGNDALGEEGNDALGEEVSADASADRLVRDALSRANAALPPAQPPARTPRCPHDPDALHERTHERIYEAEEDGGYASEGADSGGLTKSGSTSPPPPLGGAGARGERLDGKEFFRRARARLSNEHFAAFLQAIKELNSGRQTRDETLAAARGIFGPANPDLYASFDGLLSRHLPAH